jgi:hypothetical protein
LNELNTRLWSVETVVNNASLIEYPIWYIMLTTNSANPATYLGFW